MNGKISFSVADGETVTESHFSVSKVRRSGFMVWNGQLREVRELHQTDRGFQAELYPHIVPNFINSL
jgi:hypothetical protein